MYASVILLEATAPVKLPNIQCFIKIKGKNLKKYYLKIA